VFRNGKYRFGKKAVKQNRGRKKEPKKSVRKGQGCSWGRRTDKSLACSECSRNGDKHIRTRLLNKRLPKNANGERLLGEGGLLKGRIRSTYREGTGVLMGKNEVKQNNNLFQGD